MRTTSTAIAQPATNHREFFDWDVALDDVLALHQAEIEKTGLSAITQPATLDAGPALLGRLRESTARWRSAQPYEALLEEDVRSVVGIKWGYLGRRLVRLLTMT